MLSRGTSERDISSWRRALTLVVALASFACSGGGSSSGDGGGGGGGGTIDLVAESEPTLGSLASVGDLVGRVELGAPTVTPFTLHATLPVPRGSFLETSDTEPFKVVDADGNEIDSQVESVTRFPDATDGSDVIEILARVPRPVGASPGTRIQYGIVYRPHAGGTVDPNTNVVDLLATPNAIVLRTHDVFGHEYTADLYGDARLATDSVRRIKRGRAQAETATHEVLLPTTPAAGTSGTLPHSLGAHSYFRRWTSESFVSLDLRVHAGFSGRSSSTTDDDPMGAIYFEALEIVVPAGWSVLNAFDDPYIGTPYTEGGSRVYPIVRPIGDGTLHVLPRLGQFQRRLMIVADGGEARALSCLREEWLGFCRPGTNPTGQEYFSWWHSEVGRWFSQRHPLPLLSPVSDASLRATLTDKLATVEDRVTSGSSSALLPILSGNLGWAHPWGIQPGGMVGGSEIVMYDGVEVAAGASTDGYRYHELTHRMYVDRQPNVLFDDDGHHTRAAEWVVTSSGGSYLPIWWYNEPMLWASDPFGYDEAPTFQSDAVAALSKNPFYEEELSGYDPIDFQHLVRYLRSAKVLVWLGNDALAKDDIRAQAEGFRIGYYDLPQDLYQNWIPTGLYSARRYVDEYPGYGLAFGRGEGWGLDAMLVAHSLADDAWRAEALPWFQAISDLLLHGQSECTGIIQATPQFNVFGSLYRCRQSIEAAIMENALVGLRRSVLRNVDNVRAQELGEVLVRAFEAMIGPVVWSDDNNGPWAMIGVGPFDMEEPPFCTFVPSDGNYGYADHYQPWSSFAYAWELTHDQRYLDKAEEMLGGPALIPTMLADPLNNLANKAALLQLVQQIDGQPH